MTTHESCVERRRLLLLLRCVDIQHGMAAGQDASAGCTGAAQGESDAGCMGAAQVAWTPWPGARTRRCWRRWWPGPTAVLMAQGSARCRCGSAPTGGGTSSTRLATPSVRCARTRRTPQIALVLLSIPSSSLPQDLSFSFLLDMCSRKRVVILTLSSELRACDENIPELLWRRQNH